MFRNLYIIIIFMITALVFTDNIYAQTLVKKSDIEIEFIKKKIEVAPGETFHNVVKIRNTTNALIEISLFINTPRQWKTIGNATQNLLIPANQTVNIPVQVASSGASRGGVGYAVIAVINDMNGNMVASKNCLLSIPRDSRIDVKIINHQKVFDLIRKQAKFEIYVKNEGNTFQQIYLQVEPGSSLNLKSNKSPFATENMSLEPKQADTLSYTVELKEDIDIDLFRYHSTIININSNDTVLKKTIWFSSLDWKYINHIPESQIPLIIEGTAENLFTDAKPTYQVRASGNILFKKQQNFRYSIQNSNKQNIDSTPFWTQGHILLEYNKQNKTIITLGDITDNYELSMYGRGIKFQQKLFKKHKLSGSLTKRFDHDEYNTGGLYEYSINSKINIGIGAGYSTNKLLNTESYLMFAQGNSNLGKLGHLMLLYGNSITQYYGVEENQEYSGYGIKSAYSFSSNLVKIKSQFHYGSPTYKGSSGGQLRAFINASKKLNKNQFISASFSKQNYNPAIITAQGFDFDQYSIHDLYNIEYNITTKDNFQLFGGPSLNNNKTNNFNTSGVSDIFASYTISGKAGIRLFEKFTTNSITFTTIYGGTKIYESPQNANFETTLTNSSILELKLNIRRKHWSVYTSFFQGAKTLNEQFAYATTGYKMQSIMLMPSYQKNIYKDIVELIIRGTYSNYITAKSSRTYISSRINLYLKDGWSAFAGNSISLLTQRSSSTSQPQAYTSNYFRVGLKKVFNFDQPRIKHIDLDAVFYRDLNGDNLYQTNEPGVPNVLTSIKRNTEKDSIGKFRTGFSSAELISQYEGRIHVKNLPEGFYDIEYIPTTGKASEMITQRATKVFKAEKDTILHIPFTDLNKLYGRVIINKAEIPLYDDPFLGNLKILAEGNEKIYSTITDKEGYFEFYIPVSDYYKVRINDIFYEHYDLQQPYYIIKFNGYKEFELNFVYDEHERKVGFDMYAPFEGDEGYNSSGTENSEGNEDEIMELDEIAQLHQTNLRGEVREENTMNPVHSKVTVINKSSNFSIAESTSSLRTGGYFMSFISADNYKLEVTAEGYWTHKEDLKINKITTFNNLTVDVILKRKFSGQQVETSNLLFAEGSAKLETKAKAELQSLLITLHSNSDLKFKVVGHTDSREALNGNAIALSKKRADAVAEHLKAAGITPDRITSVEGIGNTKPKITEVSAETRAVNRRVEIIISGF